MAVSNRDSFEERYFAGLNLVWRLDYIFWTHNFAGDGICYYYLTPPSSHELTTVRIAVKLT